MAHSGALFALMGEAFETASNSHGSMAVAFNMDINYISSPSKGAILTAEARKISKMKKTATYEIKVTDNKDNRIASFQPLVYRKDKPLPFLES